MRRLIYSQLPLPLGTLPLITLIARFAALLLADISPSMTLKIEKPYKQAPIGRVYGRSAMVKSTNRSL